MHVIANSSNEIWGSGVNWDAGDDEKQSSLHGLINTLCKGEYIHAVEVIKSSSTEFNGQHVHGHERGAWL